MTLSIDCLPTNTVLFNWRTGTITETFAFTFPVAAFCGAAAKAGSSSNRSNSASGRIRIERCLAEELDPATFGLSERFDAIVFSYTLSMIPGWGGAVDRAVEVLKPGGALAIVDFSEQSGLPRWFRNSLRRWLVLFDVRPRAGLPDHLRAVAQHEHGSLAVEPLYRDYACLLRYRRPAAL